jgi:4-hydroxyphenylpyruvate dioxygenase
VNGGHQRLFFPHVAARARRSALWLAEDVLRRSTPLPDQLRLKRPLRTR